MNDGPDIQHKPSFKVEAGFGFENGLRVPVVEPESDLDKPDRLDRWDDLGILFDAFLAGAASPKVFYENFVMFCFEYKIGTRRPKSLRELATWLDVESHNTAKSRLTTFKAGFLAELSHLLPTDTH